MDEILQQILSELAEAKQERLAIRQEMKELTETVTENRQSQMLFEEHITKDMKALQETQTLALESWQESIKIMQETKNLIDDKLSTSIAVEAIQIDHERRITTLEHAC